MKADLEDTEYYEPPSNLIPEIESDKVLINQIKNVFEKYTLDERIREMMHDKTTQINEVLNYLLTLFALKNKKNSRANSLKYRKCHVIGIHNDEHYNFYCDVLEELGISLTENLHHFFLKQEKNI